MKKHCLVLFCLVSILLSVSFCPSQAMAVPALVSDPDPAGTNLRAAPSGKVAGVLPFTAGPRIVYVLESKKGWFNVKPFPVQEYELDDAATVPAEGWMHGSVLALCACSSEDGDPWLRVSPGWNAETDIRVPASSPLRPIDCQGEWFRVRTTLGGKNVERWIHEQQVSASVNALLECQSLIVNSRKK